MHTEVSREFKNDFLYFVVRPDKNKGEGALIYCSGVNISLFSPVTMGRHGIASNPAMRGLQLVNQGVRELSISKGAITRSLRGNDCAGIAPTRDIWYAELLAIENAPGSLPDEIIHYGVMNLVTKIFKASMRELRLPGELPSPHDLQVLLEAECKKFG